MALFCSMEILRGLTGVPFPASKGQLLDYAKQHDAPEGAVVALNQLDDMTFSDIGEVCHNVGVTCSREAADVLEQADFPATKADLVELAQERGASQAVLMTLQALPPGVLFGSLDDVCVEVT